MKKIKITALLLCLCMALTLTPVTALAASVAESYGTKASVSVENDSVVSYVVPKELFYFACYQSGTTKESDFAFRGGAFNSNSAESDVKAYSPDSTLIVPMICVWDYEEPKNDYPDNITESNGLIIGAAREQSDSWLITSLTQNFLPVYEDRAAFTKLVLPMSLERIEKYSVQDCASLTELSFFDLAGSRLTSIGECAFFNCPQLSSVELPDTLTTIGTEAFLNCPSLKSVTVPASVTKIMQHSLGFTTTDGYTYSKVSGFTIRGCKGSEAQVYAERCGFSFLATDGSAEGNWKGTGVTAIENFTEMPQAKYTQGQFTDVDENAWYGANKNRAVQTAYELRIVNGKGEGKFDPNGNVLLCEAIKMAAVVHSIYCGENGVLIAKSWEKWYEPYVDYCVEAGIIGSGDFSGDYSRPATRAEMAYIFANTLPYDEMDEINDVTVLPDVTADTPYYDDILTMYRCGALQGNDEYGTFTPDTNITRAAAAAIITRIALPSHRLSFTLTEKKAPAPSEGSAKYTPFM